MGKGFISRFFGSVFGPQVHEDAAGKSIKPSADLQRSGDTYMIEDRTERLQKFVDALNVDDGMPLLSKALMVETYIGRLAELAPASPLLGAAANALESFKARHPEEFAPLPALRGIGETRDVCPSCGVALLKRPARKTICKSCGQAIFVRKRPLDEQSVLVNEAGAAEIEKDWHVQYKLSQQRPRPVSDEWMSRIDEARTAGPDPDPAVEKMAQALFKELLATYATDAPRDAKDKLLAQIPDTEVRDRVDRRIWQLQVQYLG
ncbi:MAG: hypothetical protein RLY71_2301 [Pseudomonadota bacterium]|jgi:uncharacterized Zn finger protein (UPF0148 family)